ncbi:hypothetical protein GRJ2_003504700 [Grus japonensis]|uniref:SGNH hydrolase-type esterase domain-containing protein n=1 Tax=Grus japonensis TaxID=30415 RepID=A0ABC9YJZ4_GRUJA
MVDTRLRAKASVPTENISPEMSDASTQMELIRKETSVQAVGCSECQDPSPGEKVSTCARCAQIDDLLRQVAELQETVKRLCSIRGAEMEKDRWFHNQVPVASTTENEAPWTLVTHKSRALLQSSPSSFTTKNRYEALTAIDTHEQGVQGETVPAAHSGYRKKKRRVLIVGDSLLRGTEAPICRPDRESREVYCLLGAKIQDVAKRVPQLVKSTDYYPLLLFHVGTNDAASQNLGRIKEDYKALGVQVKNIGAQAIFSSILPVGGKGAARNRHIIHINSWLRVWCHREGFGFYDNGTFYDDYNLLERDGIHLSRRGKGIFGSRLANLVKRALN